MMQQKALGARLFFVIFFILFLSEIAIAGVPIPWGAKLIRNDVFSSSGEERKIASYETKASKQELLNYYLREMPNQGYSLFMNGEQNIIFKKKEELVIIILPPSGEGKTKFMITISSLGPSGARRGGETPCENIPSIPAYPGARCGQSVRMGSGNVQTVMYFSADAIDTVLNYYRSFMLRSQWHLEQEIALSDKIPTVDQAGVAQKNIEAAASLLKGARSMRFVNDRDNRCAITVMNNPVGGGTGISITYEEKISKQ